MSTKRIYLVDCGTQVNKLYQANIRVYLGEKTMEFPDLESVLVDLSSNKHESLIICHSSQLEQHDVISLQEHRVIILGDNVEGLKKSTHLFNKFDLKKLLRECADYLQITAVDMARKEVQKYYSFSSDFIEYLEKANVDIYVESDGDYELLYEKGADIDDTQIIYDDYIYVNAYERLTFMGYLSMKVMAKIKIDDMDEGEQLGYSSHGMNILAEEILRDPKANEEISEISRQCIDAIYKATEAVPNVKNLIGMLLKNQSGFVFSHTVLSTYIAQKIIGNMDWGSKEQKEKIAYVLFFHDIYLVPIYQKYDHLVDEHDLLFCDDVTDEDKEIIFDHAILAASLVKGLMEVPLGADMIILHHHGEVKGKGFAEFFGDDISPLAKVVLVAHEVSSHILMNVFAGEAHDAFDMEMIEKILLDKFKRNSYKKLISAFMKIKL